MRKLYILLFIFSIFQMRAQTVASTTIICFRDANNNGVKEVSENAITSSIGLLLTDSASISMQVHYCGVPLTLTMTSTQPNYFLLLPYRLNQHSSFWKAINPISVFHRFYKFGSVSHNFGNIVYVPIPPNYGDGYIPVSDNLYNPGMNNTYTCINDSIDFNIRLGNIDSTCMPINTYTFNPNTKVDVDLYVNNLLLNSFNILQTSPPSGQTGNSSIISYNGVIMWLKISSTTFSIGTNSVKYVIKNVPGYTVNSIAEYTFNTINVPCGQLTGYTYIDCNGNCIEDSWESYNNSIFPYNYTVTSISDTFNLSSNGIINTGLPYGNYTLTTSGPCPNSTVFTIPSTNTIVLSQPTVTPMWNHKINLSFCCGNAAVPGGTIDAAASLFIDNGVCDPPSQYPNKIKMVLPPDMFYLGPYNMTPAPSNTISSITGDTIVWNLGSTPTNFIYEISVGIKTTAVIGNPYAIKSIILPHTDLYISDDSHTLYRFYGGPYDPNNKESNHPNMMSNGNIIVPVSTNEMVYTINFQNLGNSPAKNIWIRDTLSSLFNLKSFKILNSSYPVTSQVNNTTGEVLFQFSYINLPPGSASDYTNRGHVTYKIDMNPNLPIGTSLKNRAHIYFDYNSAITTNQTVNTLVDPTGIFKNFNSQNLQIYPNPSNGDLFIQSKTNEVAKYEIYDVVGKKIMAGELINNRISTANLNEGVYFLKLHSADGQSTVVKFYKAN